MPCYLVGSKITIPNSLIMGVMEYISLSGDTSLFEKALSSLPQFKIGDRMYVVEKFKARNYTSSYFKGQGVQVVMNIKSIDGKKDEIMSFVVDSENNVRFDSLLHSQHLNVSAKVLGDACSNIFESVLKSPSVNVSVKKHLANEKALAIAKRLKLTGASVSSARFKGLQSNQIGRTVKVSVNQLKSFKV